MLSDSGRVKQKRLGKTEISAPESTRKLTLLKGSLTNKRHEDCSPLTEDN